MADPILAAHRRMQTESRKSATLADLLAPFRAGRAATKEWDAARATKEGFKASTWVFRAIRVKMQAAASVPLIVRSRTTKGKYEPDPEHPFQKLINRPNEHLSFQDLIETCVSHLDLAGNAIWSKVGLTASRRRERRGPQELWPIKPGPVSPVPSRTKFIDHYVYAKENGRSEKFQPHEIVHFRYVNPDDPRWGISPMQAAARAVDLDVEQSRWQLDSMDNRAVPDGVFAFQGLGDEQLKEARKAIRSHATGRANARDPLVLSGTDVKWSQMGLSPAEMDFIESRKMNREEIVSVFGVPLAMAGPLEDTTLANFETSRRHFWEDEMVTLLWLIETTINMRLAHDFGEPDEVRAVFDLSGVTALRESTSEKIKQLVQLTQEGVPLNVGISMLELKLDPVEGGDVGLVPANRVPLAFAAGGGTDTEAL